MRYEPLARLLDRQSTGEVRMTFADIERVLARGLPPSARRHQAWWANTRTHSHARAWLGAGWRTHDLDLAGEAVAFQRDRRATARARAGPARIVLPPDALSAAALRLVDKLAEESRGSRGEAVADLINGLAARRKRELFGDFPFVGERSAVDSVDLIREDRDGR